MKLTLFAAVILMVAGTPASAHRLDEYLQGTIVTLEKDRVSVQMTLTPGVAVFPVVMATIGDAANGAITDAAQRAYAVRVLGDVSMAIDGHPLTPHLLSLQFPTVEQMQNGLGEIRIEFDAALTPGGLNRKLIFENHHLSKIAAYQVNSLKPSDPDIRIVAQNRDYTQSHYEVDFTQPGIRADFLLSWLPGLALVVVVGLTAHWKMVTKST